MGQTKAARGNNKTPHDLELHLHEGHVINSAFLRLALPGKILDVRIQTPCWNLRDF